jgi:hypothetical protein
MLEGENSEPQVLFTADNISKHMADASLSQVVDQLVAGLVKK